MCSKEQKKNQGGGSDCPYHHRPNAPKFTRKKWQILTRFLRPPLPVGPVERSTLRVQIFLPEFVFFYY
jgi:hypothetical protein